MYAISCKKEIAVEIAILSHKANVQGTIVKRYLDNIFRLKKSISFKNLCARFTLRISANQDLEPKLFRKIGWFPLWS